MRKLASIQRITKIEPIENADNIVLATIKNWKVIVKKDEFKENDLVIYCEIDSVLPEKPEFDFLKKYNYRIKTIKIKGKISQGICFPLSILPNNLVEEILNNNLIDYDVTEILGIKQYIPDSNLVLGGEQLGSFPVFIPKTDEERIQNILDFDNFVKDKYFYVSEKLDGTSATYYFYENHIGVCSRNIELRFTENNLYWSIFNKYNISEKLRELKKNIAIQGEIIGNKVQKNVYRLSDNQFYVFSIFDIDKQEYYSLNEMIKFCISNNLLFVPIISHRTNITETVDKLILLADGKSSINPDVNREGLVYRQVDTNKKVSFKVISNNYLLKNE